MAKPHKKIYELVGLIEKHGPISPNALTDMTGDHRQSIDKYIRLAHQAEMIHIARFAPSPFGGKRTVKEYAYGKGVDAYRKLDQPQAKPRKTDIAPESRRGMKFSEAEKKILREIKFSGKTVKSQLHRLPGRTLYGVQRAISGLKGKKKRGFSSWIWGSIIATLRETPNLTSVEISEAIGCTKRQVVVLLEKNHVEDNRSVHISGWMKRRGDPVRCWSLGNLADAERPKPQSHDNELKKRRAAHHLRRARANPFAMTVAHLREAA